MSSLHISLPHADVGSGPIAQANNLGNIHEIQGGDEAEGDVLEAGEGDAEVLGPRALTEHGDVQEQRP